MVFLSKRWMFCGVIIFEIMGCWWYLWYGHYGYKELGEKHAHNQQLLQEIKVQKKEIEKVRKQVQKWKTSLFLQEKYAREKLHMGKKDETIFFYE